MKMTKSMANVLLLITSVLWGSGFIVIKIALNANASPGFINFFRGSLFVILVLIFFNKKIFKLSLF